MVLWKGALESLVSIMKPNFWRDKNVFITGHTGFKGSWLSLWLQELGAITTGYALSSPTKPSLYEEAGVGLGMRSVVGDIRNHDLLLDSLQEARPEIVFHLAAQPLVRNSYESPAYTYETNVIGTVNLLECIRQVSSVRAVVNVTTDKCYENREWIWGYRESDPMGGYDPYSSSKACSELVTSAYRSSFFNPTEYQAHGVAIATARAGNVIGGGDWSDNRLIPDILRAFIKGETVKIRNPSAIRPWQHVLEPLRGYLILAEKLQTYGPPFAEGWNFGPQDDDARPVEWIVQFLAQLWGNEAKWEFDAGKHRHEANYLKLDISKAKSRLDWSPVLDLQDALGYIIEWSRARESGEDVGVITRDQIFRYQQMLDTLNSNH